MAIRARSLLRKWFGRGQYPTAEQFSDVFDSFVHRDEDKIALDKVDELPDLLNGKYGQDEGVRLEGQVKELSNTLSGHIDVSNDHFTRLDEGLEAEISRAEGEEAAIREELAAGDASTLQSAKFYTDTETSRAEREEATIREELADGDAATLQTAKSYTDAETSRAEREETAIREELADGDAATLQTAKSYTDAETSRAEREETAIREELADGDDATLQTAKSYTDTETSRAEREEAAIREELADGDAATLQNGKTYADRIVADEAALREQGDATTLQSAKTYTDAETARAKGEEAAIRNALTAGDAATLQSGKTYTNEQIAAEATLREQGDAATLQSAKRYTDVETARAEGEETAIREELAKGDAATLQSGKTYADGKVAAEAALREQGDAATLQSANEHIGSLMDSEQVARESGDRTTLQSAKDYVDAAIAELVDGSPAALDTLKELSTALGDDPNFAATVAGQIGQKVDKVTGKGLSTEDYTTSEKSKLAGIATGANKYEHPATHLASMIIEDASHRFVTDNEKTTWSGKETTTGAQTKATKALTDAKAYADGLQEETEATMIAHTGSKEIHITSDERASWNGKASTAVATASADGLMSAADKTKLDGIATGANRYEHPATHLASMIVEDKYRRFITDDEREAWNSKATGVVATPSVNGLMSAADKAKLDGIASGANKYVHPTAHSASIIKQDASHRFVTDLEKSTWSGKASTAVATASADGLMSAADKTKLDGLQKILTVKLGSTSYTYDGSADRTVNISPDSIGALAINGWPQEVLAAVPTYFGWSMGRTATIYVPGTTPQSHNSAGHSFSVKLAQGTPMFVLNINNNISTAVSNLVIETSHSAVSKGSGTRVFDYEAGINLCGTVLFTKKQANVVLQITGFMFYPSAGQYYMFYDE